jgi:DNA-binding NarL/FixJ family response regulator
MLAELIARPGRVEVVGVARTEATTIDSARALKPDVVIVDLQLAEGSGTNVIKAVRADPALASMRIVVASNHTSPQLRAGCLQMGADHYFDKVKELGALARCLEEMGSG